MSITRCICEPVTIYFVLKWDCKQQSPKLFARSNLLYIMYFAQERGISIHLTGLPEIVQSNALNILRNNSFIFYRLTM